MARMHLGNLAAERFVDAETEARIARNVTTPRRLLFAHWALTFLGLDDERFGERVDDWTVTFSWWAQPPYHEDAVEVRRREL